MKVFLSYRRADSQSTAGRMAQFLDGIPAVRDTFLDVDAIGIGENFEAKIKNTLREATHVFVLIGPEWIGPRGEDGRPRIFDPQDFVRQESKLALASKTKLIPILLDGASMPKAADLPEDLRALPKINAFMLRTSHFEEDMDDLLDAVFGHHEGRGSRWARARLTPLGVAWRIAAGLAGAALALVFLAMVNRYFVPNDCIDLVCGVGKATGLPQGEAMGLVAVMSILVLAGGAVAPFWSRIMEARRRKRL